MKAQNHQIILAAALVGTLAWTTLQAQQFPLAKTAADVPGPAAGNTMTKEYVQMVGRMAYVWGYPLVNSHNRRESFAKAPTLGLVGGVLPAAPIGQVTMLTDYISPEQTFVTCPNQDVVYGAGYFALDKQPVVFQVPDFGDRFWVYALYDGRTDEFSEIGKALRHEARLLSDCRSELEGTNTGGHHSRGAFFHRFGFAAPRIFKDDTAAGHARPSSPYSTRSYSIRSASSTGR